jgi:uncharacterized UBP type Zn finger protein
MFCEMVDQSVISVMGVKILSLFLLKVGKMHCHSCLLKLYSSVSVLVFIIVKRQSAEMTSLTDVVMFIFTSDVKGRPMHA